ncbi:MAG: hypothetical protein ACYDAD_07925 [Acidimicrobiales bacterium]
MTPNAAEHRAPDRIDQRFTGGPDGYPVEHALGEPVVFLVVGEIDQVAFTDKETETFTGLLRTQRLRVHAAYTNADVPGQDLATLIQAAVDCLRQRRDEAQGIQPLPLDNQAS